MAGGSRSAAVKKAWVTRRAGKGGGGWGVVGARKVGLPGDLVGRKPSSIPGDLVPDKRIKSYADVHAALLKSWKDYGGAKHSAWKKKW